MAEKLDKDQIAAIKKKRARDQRLMQDRLRFWVGVFSVPSIMIMVGVLVGSAYYLKSEALAVVTGLVSTVTLGLINVLQQMTAPPEKEDSVLTLAKENAHLQEMMAKNLMNKESAKITMDRNKVEINGNGVEAECTTPESATYGDDPPLKGKYK